MKNFLKNNTVLAIVLLATTVGLKADGTTQSASNTNFLDTARTWLQDKFGSQAGAYLDQAKSWLSEKLNFDVSTINPARAQEVIGEIRTKISNANPEQIAAWRNALQQKIADLESTLRNAPPAEKAKFQETLSNLKSLATEKFSNNKQDVIENIKQMISERLSSGK